jgi:hypothetical protein
MGALSEGAAMFQEYVQAFRAAFETAGPEIPSNGDSFA